MTICAMRAGRRTDGRTAAAAGAAAAAAGCSGSVDKNARRRAAAAARASPTDTCCSSRGVTRCYFCAGEPHPLLLLLLPMLLPAAAGARPTGRQASEHLLPLDAPIAGRQPRPAAVENLRRSGGVPDGRARGRAGRWAPRYRCRQRPEDPARPRESEERESARRRRPSVGPRSAG